MPRRLCRFANTYTTMGCDCILSKTSQGQEVNITDSQSVMEGLVTTPNSEQGNGEPEDPVRPLPPRFWGARESYS